MQTDDLEIELPSPCFNNPMDAALQRLGMLASTSNSRRQYLQELRKTNNRLPQPAAPPYLQINTRYVSNVSIGFRLRPLTPHVRYKPYPLREKRHRTRSENNDNVDALAPISASTASYHSSSMMVPKVDEIDLLPDLAQLKKAKSLESIVGENGDLKTSIQIPNCPELEVVSNSIQNLKVAE